MMKTPICLCIHCFICQASLLNHLQCAECGNTTVAQDNNMFQWRSVGAERGREMWGEKGNYTEETRSFFFLRATTADEFGCPGLLNHHGAADSSAETNDFDFTCDITSKLWSQSI